MAKPKKKLVIPGDYSRGTTSPHDFVRPSKPKKDEGIFPTAIAVACTYCKATGTVDMPLDADVEKLADKMIDGRIVRGFCGNCRQMVEFRPFTPDELKTDGLRLLGRYIENYDELKVQENADEVRITSPGDAVSKALEASNEYVDQVKKKMKAKEPLIASPEEGDGSIIIP